MTNKTIHDPLYGSIKLEGTFLKILDSPEMQRLREVKQLGTGNLVFPGANHSRFEHSLGVYHLATKMSEAIKLNKDDSDVVRIAALLHDICHAPFSHTMEEIMEERTGLNHMDLAEKLIKGEFKTYMDRDDDILDSSMTLSEILEKDGIPSNMVCDLIKYPVTHDKDLYSFDKEKSHFPSKDYAHQIIHGPVDADQMDYLMRDAHYTGVSFGNIDVSRILETIKIHNDRIVIERRGIPAVEGLMVSRALMYSSVYFHQTVKISKAMMTKAVEESSMDLSRMYLWTDSYLSNCLINEGGASSKIMRLIHNRILYKKAFSLSTEDTSEEMVTFLSEHSSYSKRKQLELEIADKAEIDLSEVTVDMPSRSSLQSKIQIGKTDISILEDDKKVKSISRISPIAKAIQARNSFGWSVMIATPKENLEKVNKATKKILNL